MRHQVREALDEDLAKDWRRQPRSDRRSSLLLTRQPEPPALVLNEPGCYHFRVLDPRESAILSATMNVITIGPCSHI